MLIAVAEAGAAKVVIEAVAHGMRAAGPPVAIGYVATVAGATLRALPLPENVYAFATRAGDEITLFVNSLASSVEVRWAAAKHLGHALIQTPGVQMPEFEAGSQTPLDGEHEAEASRFAAAVLMPEQTLRASYRRQPDCDALARWYAVPPLAMRARLSELRLLRTLA